MGLRRGRSRRLARTPGMAWSVGASMRLSWRLAPLNVRPSGVPRASVTRWRFVPGLPLSVGFGPTASPPFWRPRWPWRAPPGSSPGLLHPGGAPIAPGADLSRPRGRATRPAGASMSRRNRPARSAPRATERPSATRRRCPPGLPDPAHAADRPSAWASTVKAAVPSPPKGHQERGAPSLLNASAQVLSRGSNKEETRMSKDYRSPKTLILTVQESTTLGRLTIAPSPVHEPLFARDPGLVGNPETG